MTQTSLLAIALGAAYLCTLVSTAAFAQDYKKGDEVVAVKKLDLRVSGKVRGTVPKGERLTVEQVKDKWLWVRYGETSGWIDSSSVLSARVTFAGRVTIKFYQASNPGFARKMAEHGDKRRVEADERRKRAEQDAEKRRELREKTREGMRSADPEVRRKAQEELTRGLTTKDRVASDMQRHREELAKALSGVTPSLQGEFDVASDVPSRSVVRIGGRQFHLECTECQEEPDSRVTLSATLEESTRRSNPLQLVIRAKGIRLGTPTCVGSLIIMSGQPQGSALVVQVKKMN
jgi:uncharacterized protein YgiM (DUF1202 family)